MGLLTTYANGARESIPVLTLRKRREGIHGQANRKRSLSATLKEIGEVTPASGMTDERYSYQLSQKLAQATPDVFLRTRSLSSCRASCVADAHCSRSAMRRSLRANPKKRAKSSLSVTASVFTGIAYVRAAMRLLAAPTFRGYSGGRTRFFRESSIPPPCRYRARSKS